MKKFTLFALLGTVHKLLNLLLLRRQKSIVILIFISINVIIYSQSTWQKIFPQYYGSVTKVLQASDNNFISLGDVRVNNYYTMQIMKYSQDGNVLWDKLIGRGNCQSYWISNSRDSCLIFGGSIDSGLGRICYIAKMNLNGDIIWEKAYTNFSHCYFINQTSDDGYVISAKTDELYEKFKLVKLSNTGLIQWEKIYGEPLKRTHIWEIKLLQDGYIGVGWVSAGGQSGDMLVIRTNTSGDSIWTRKYGGSYSDGGYSIDNCPGGFVLAGDSRSFDSTHKSQSYIVKIDNNGSVVWEKCYSGLGTEFARSIKYKSSIGFVMAGYSDTLDNGIDVAKLRFIDLNGNNYFENSLLPNSQQSIFKSIELTSDNGFILGGYVAYVGAFVNSYVAKTDQFGYSNPIGLNIISSEIPGKFTLHQNYPNPFNPVTKIKFELPKSADLEFNVYDILGRKVYSANYSKPAGTYEIDFDGSDFASGIYFYSLNAGEYKETKKMIILK